MHLWDSKRAGIHIWDFWMEQSIWVCTCVATGNKSSKCLDKIFLLRFWNWLQYWFGPKPLSEFIIFSNQTNVLIKCFRKDSECLQIDLVCRYGILGMQIWTFSKHQTFKYDFREKTQYSNMNFWCFLVTPDDQHIITSSISASAASVLQHHWCINTNSISVSAESLHQQHTCIISISTSVASLHQQRHCISAYSHQQYQHIISISASTT